MEYLLFILFNIFKILFFQFHLNKLSKRCALSRRLRNGREERLPGIVFIENADFSDFQ